jgi:hypothetical protein
MRRLLVLVQMTLLIACAPAPTPPRTVTPSPAVVVTSAPSVSPMPSGASIGVICGPLVSEPDGCAAAVEAAIRLKDVGVAWSSVRVDPPDKTCAGVASPCRAPTIVVRFVSSRESAAVAEVPLVRATTGWISFRAIR